MRRQPPCRLVLAGLLGRGPSLEGSRIGVIGVIDESPSRRVDFPEGLSHGRDGRVNWTKVQGAGFASFASSGGSREGQACSSSYEVVGRGTSLIVVARAVGATMSST